MKTDKQASEEYSTSIVILGFLAIAVGVVVLVYFLAADSEVNPNTDLATDVASTASTSADRAASGEETFSTISTSSTYYEVTAELPTADSALAGAQAVRADIQENIDEFITQANEQGPELEATRGQVLQYQKDLSVQVFTSGTYTSYYIEDYSFTGGANGNATVQTMIFNESTAEVSEDIITPNQQPAFVAAVKEELRGRDFAQGDTFGSIIDELSFADLNFYLNEAEEIVVVFSEYAVAPGAAGIVTVTLPKAPYLTQ